MANFSNLRIVLYSILFFYHYIIIYNITILGNQSLIFSYKYLTQKIHVFIKFTLILLPQKIIRYIFIILQLKLNTKIIGPNMLIGRINQNFIE